MAKDDARKIVFERRFEAPMEVVAGWLTDFRERGAAETQARMSGLIPEPTEGGMKVQREENHVLLESDRSEGRIVTDVALESPTTWRSETEVTREGKPHLSVESIESLRQENGATIHRVEMTLTPRDMPMKMMMPLMRQRARRALELEDDVVEARIRERERMRG